MQCSKITVILIFHELYINGGKMHVIHKLHHKCTSTNVYKGHDTDSSLEGD